MAIYPVRIPKINRKSGGGNSLQKVGNPVYGQRGLFSGDWNTPVGGEYQSRQVIGDDSSEDVLGHVSALVKKTGVMCEVVVGLHIDTSGVVQMADILKSSGNRACDSAVEKWAPTTRWTTAYNRDEPVAVWITQPVRIETE